MKMAADKQSEIKSSGMDENKENCVDETLGLESILTEYCMTFKRFHLVCSKWP